MSSPNHPLTVGSRFGPYRLDRLIGRGGMGEVYQAYDTVKDRTVAIKVLPERLAEDTLYRQRFQRESHAAARLREAHVIPIHDYGEIDGRLYIDMRLVDGDSLRSLLHRHGPGAPEDAVAVVEQVAAALDAAHRDGLLHRDVKPDNILVTHEGFVYLVDFGIAQSATDESLTQDGGAVGSYRYMAPERFATRELGPTADVYGLACVLFECLTGTKPFSGGNEAQIMNAHMFDPIPRPSLVRPTVPAAFDAVIAGGMAKDPAERYGSAGELAAAARAALGTNPIPKPTGSTPGRTSSVPHQADTVTHTGPAPGNEPGTPLPDPSGGTGHDPAARSPHRARLPRIAALLGVLVLVAASLTFAGWAYRRHTTPGTPVADAGTLRGPDIDLFSQIGWNGYHRANCVHNGTDENVVSFISCDPNPAAGAPAARFFRFTTANAMHDYYNSIFLGTMSATNCPGDPAGKDGPVRLNGQELGRIACYADRSTGTAGNPAYVLTDESELALAAYIWDAPAKTALRDYFAKYDAGWFRTKQNARDPDYFTDADNDLLGKLNDPYIRANCRHENPPPGPVSAVIDCDTKIDDPSVSFIAMPTRDAAMTVYQADVGQFPGRMCAGGNGSDEVWRRQTKPIGRYTCYTDKTTDPTRPHPALLAVYEDLHLLVLVAASTPDYPENAPKDDASLRNWFEKYFTQ